MTYRNRFFLLSFIGFVLACIIAMELISTESTFEARPADLAQIALPVPAPALPVAAPPRGQWSETLLERPLFSPERRGVAPVARSDGPASRIGPLPRLTGIIVSPNGRRAIFQASSDDKPTVMGEGESLSGWRIDAISSGHVKLVGPSGEQLVTPELDQSLAPPSASAKAVPLVLRPAAAPPRPDPSQPEASFSPGAMPRGPLLGPAPQPGALPPLPPGAGGAGKPSP